MLEILLQFKDYAGNFQTNNLTIGRNGSKIEGASIRCNNITVEWSIVTLVFVDATKGWINSK